MLTSSMLLLLLEPTESIDRARAKGHGRRREEDLEVVSAAVSPIICRSERICSNRCGVSIVDVKRNPSSPYDNFALAAGGRYRCTQD